MNMADDVTVRNKCIASDVKNAVRSAANNEPMTFLFV